MQQIISDFPKKVLPIPEEAMIREKLAIEGGPALISAENRPTQFPDITKEDIFALMIDLKKPPSQIIAEFEEEYRQRVGTPYAMTLASGTASLHIALIAAGVGAGDEVIVPAFTFIATAQAVVAAKAIPVFVDIDAETYCIDPKAVEAAITSKTKAIMPVHTHGLPANISALRQICQKYGLKLVEDASHAHSASIEGIICGNMGDTAGQSLMADKNFPLGGEAGIAFFQTEQQFKSARDFLEQTGIDYHPSWIAVAFGKSQLTRLPYYDEVRSQNAQYLRNALMKTGLFQPPVIPIGYRHSFNMFRIKLDPDVIGIKEPCYKVKAAVQEILNAEGIAVREWQNCPIPGHRPFQNRRGFGKGYPFTLSSRNFGYEIANFPKTLEMLGSTIVLCRELRSPIQFHRVMLYGLAFQKVANRPDAILKLIQSRNYPAPYQTAPRLG